MQNPKNIYVKRLIGFFPYKLVFHSQLQYQLIQKKKSERRCNNQLTIFMIDWNAVSEMGFMASDMLLFASHSECHI